MAYLDQMYSGMQPQRTAPMGDQGFYQGAPEISYGSDSPYTPKKGKWVSMAGVTEPGIGGTAEQGYWTADPNVDYGQAPEAGMGQFFDQQGNFAGWTSGRSGSSGSGLFGDFGGQQTAKQYHIDPATGKLMDPTIQTHDPSRSGVTKFMSYAMPIAMMAGLGAGAAGGAFSGAAAGTGAAPSGASWGLTGGSFGTGGAATAADVAAALGTSGAGSTAATLGGGIPELGFGGNAAVPPLGPGGGAVPGIGGFEGAATGSFSGAGGFQELLKQYGPKALEVLGGMSPEGQGKQSGKADYGSLLDKIFGIGKGIYDARQIKDYSGNLKGIYSDLNNRQDQFRNPLLSSYQDPNVFFNSNQWKGLESVYQNKLDRGASKEGRVANTIDREVKLNNYAMQELENFRKGLRDSAMMTRPEAALGPLAEGYKAEAYANTPIGAALDQLFGSRSATGGTRGGNVTDIAKQITSFGGDVNKIYEFISGWFK